MTQGGRWKENGGAGGAERYYWQALPKILVYKACLLSGMELIASPCLRDVVGRYVCLLSSSLS